jgi:H+-transporting ATPase
MINAKTLEHNEAGQLTVQSRPPQATVEHTVAFLPAELVPGDLVPVEARDLLAEYDRIEPPKQQTTHPLSVFLSFFWGPIPWLIESSAILSAVARRWEVSGIVLILLLVDAYLGFWQAYQAGNVIATIKDTLP